MHLIHSSHSCLILHLIRNKEWMNSNTHWLILPTHSVLLSPPLHRFQTSSQIASSSLHLPLHLHSIIAEHYTIQMNSGNGGVGEKRWILLHLAPTNKILEKWVNDGNISLHQPLIVWWKRRGEFKGEIVTFTKNNPGLQHFPSMRYNIICLSTVRLPSLVNITSVSEGSDGEKKNTSLWINAMQ